MMVAALRTLIGGQHLSSDEAESLMKNILDGATEPEQIGALLTAFHFHPPDGRSLAGFVRALREKMETSRLHLPHAIDVCGTGGDGAGTFNISTAVAFVVAASGQVVAKHGNRAVSSRCGSFDVLEALGVPFCETAAAARESLHLHQLAFMYAPSFHPAMQRLAPVRKHLGFRTVFNALGPLLNPARVERQLIGVYSESLLVPVAEALAELGAKNVMVVYGLDGSDEISLLAPTRIARFYGGRLSVSTFQPSTLGLSLSTAASLAGGDAKQNAHVLQTIFSGQTGPPADIVALNAAAALVVSERAEDFNEGFAQAQQILQTGAAARLLARMAVETTGAQS